MEATKRGCPCVELSQDCSEKCRCQQCNNNKYSASKDRQGCRCAVSKCHDPADTGKRKCKCPCFRRSLKCTDKCRCKGCANPLGAYVEGDSSKSKGVKVKKEAYTRAKKANQMANKSDTLNAAEGMLDLLERDRWTLQETVTLHTCAELSLSDFGKICLDSVNVMFEFVCANQFLCPEIAVSKKSRQEIVSKLTFMRFI